MNQCIQLRNGSAYLVSLADLREFFDGCQKSNIEIEHLRGLLSSASQALSELNSEEYKRQIILLEELGWLFVHMLVALTYN
jgi:hypothetical protein